MKFHKIKNIKLYIVIRDVLKRIGMKKEDPSNKSKFYINIFPKFDNFIINFKQLEVMN